MITELNGFYLLCWVAYLLPIAVYFGLGCEGDFTLKEKKYTWDKLIFVPILNLIALIWIIVLLLKELVNLILWFRRK